MTVVPFFSGSLMYSSFAFAPCAPFLDAPSQWDCSSSTFSMSSYTSLPLTRVTRVLSSSGSAYPGGGGENEQRLALDEARDLARRFVVVHAFYGAAALGEDPAYLVLPVLLIAHGIVVIDDRYGVLPRTAAQHVVEVRALFLVVEVLVLDKDLPHAETAVDELSVRLHEYGLPLRGIVRLVLLVRTAEFPARALDVVQPAYLRRTRSHPDVSGAKFARKACYDVVVHVLILSVYESHGAYLSYEFDVEIRHNYLLDRKSVV